MLSRQGEGDYHDCWMTDSVMKVPPDEDVNQIAI